MVREEESPYLQGKLQLGSAFQRRDTIDMTESTECVKTPAVAGGEEEVTSMGDIMCDIFNSQFCHGNFAPTSPQDLFGILDILESPDQDASKFLSLLEESSAGNNDGTHFPAISPLKLPVLEQEPELDNPEPLIHRAIRDNFPSRPDNSPEVNAHSNSLSIDHIALSHAIAHRPDQPKGKRQLTEISDRAIQNNKADDRRLISQKSCEEVMQKSEASFQFRRETITDHARPSDFSESETDTLEKPSIKRFKAFTATSEEGDGAQRMTHIAVERNRRKQMNEHLAVLRSLMPGFYVQRGDQASIIGGVIEFIKELQQLLQSLESKKQRKAYTEVLSPRPTSSPRPSLSPRTLPVSPRTPQPCNPYRSKIQSFIPSTIDQNFETVKELVANSKSAVADVEVKISGSNALLKTLSHKTPGQILKIVKALEKLSLEILHLNISTIDDTVLNSFTLKIGIECKLSVEELAQAVQQTFC